MKHLIATGILAAGLLIVPVSHADAQYLYYSSYPSYYSGYYGYSYPAYSYGYSYSPYSYYSNPGYSFSFSYLDRDWDRGRYRNNYRHSNRYDNYRGPSNWNRSPSGDRMGPGRRHTY